jgi:hypothetical protein
MTGAGGKASHYIILLQVRGSGEALLVFFSSFWVRVQASPGCASCSGGERGEERGGGEVVEVVVVVVAPHDAWFSRSVLPPLLLRGPRHPHKSPPAHAPR